MRGPRPRRSNPEEWGRKRLELDQYLHATRAELLRRLDRVEDARALELVHSDVELPGGLPFERSAKITAFRRPGGGSMLDHVGFSVSDYERSKAFYEQALAPLGLTLLMEPMPGIGGFGEDGKPFFWIGTRGPAPQSEVHVAFAVDDRETVDAFHAAALAAGGTDNGAPGVREIYHPTYYGAYVLDPDGNNVEAVCHRPA